MKYKLINNDCLEVLKKIGDNKIDSIITDPPYGLGTVKDISALLSAWMTGEDESLSIGKNGFMGKEWDKCVPSPKIWKECLRVLKPGGHLLVFAGTRTQDLMGISIRLAGFELRDEISYLGNCHWVYGSGFPKSHNISKAIDKKFGAYKKGKVSPNSRNNIKGMNKHYNHAKIMTIDEPQSNQAKQWEGWGTALKPAHEPILMFRKPLGEKTVADNVLKHGTGGINIDACRIETSETITNHSRGNESAKSKGIYGDSSGQETHQTSGQLLGRFPANIILSKDVDIYKLKEHVTAEELLKLGNWMNENT